MLSWNIFFSVCHRQLSLSVFCAHTRGKSFIYLLHGEAIIFRYARENLRKKKKAQTGNLFLGRRRESMENTKTDGKSKSGKKLSWSKLVPETSQNPCLFGGMCKLRLEQASKKFGVRKEKKLYNAMILNLVAGGYFLIKRNVCLAPEFL